MPQGGDVALVEVLELATGATAVGIEGAHLEFHVHGQAQVVDQKLHAPTVHVTHP
ncbi:hypothetical protein D3C73_1590120 [compost metagenome]